MRESARRISSEVRILLASAMSLDLPSSQAGSLVPDVLRNDGRSRKKASRHLLARGPDSASAEGPVTERRHQIGHLASLTGLA